MVVAVVLRPPWCPHSWRLDIRQSANILGDCSMRRRREWVTMAATVDHSSHNASMAFLLNVGCVSRRNTQGIIPDNWRYLPGRVRKSVLPASAPSARQPLGQIGHGAASSGQRHHEVMMCGGGGGKIGGKGAGGDDSSMMQIFALIDHGG